MALLKRLSKFCKVVFFERDFFFNHTFNLLALLGLSTGYEHTSRMKEISALNLSFHMKTHVRDKE